MVTSLAVAGMARRTQGLIRDFLRLDFWNWILGDVFRVVFGGDPYFWAINGYFVEQFAQARLKTV